MMIIGLDIKVFMHGKKKTKYRKYRRMTAQEQKETGYPTDSEILKEGVSPISILLGFDPFITYDELNELEKDQEEKLS